MKHHKLTRILSALLALTLLLAITPQLALAAHAAETSGKCGDNLTWSFDEATGTLTISGYGAMDDFDEFDEEIGYYDSPWNGLRGKIKTVILSDGLTRIGNMAFAEFFDLTEVSIPDSVTAIGAEAFEECIALTSVRLPDSVESIGFSAFSETAYYNDPGNWIDGICYLSSWAVAARGMLDTVSILPGTVGIADGLFANPDAFPLVRVTLPEGLKYIGASVFGMCQRLTSIELPATLTSIGYSAFGGCDSLTSIELPATLTSIGESAFAGCDGLRSVTIPAGVTSIGEAAFSGCTRLTSISVAPGNPSYCSVDGVVFSKDKKELVQFPTGRTGTYRIPAGVTRIGNSAFESSHGLDEIILPNGVTSIGAAAFCDCDKIRSISIPESVTEIGHSAFASCICLTSVNLPPQVTQIAEGLFFSCLSLESFVIPETVTSIGDGAFMWCLYLKWVLIPESVTSIGEDVFYVCENFETIYGYAGSAAQAYAEENGEPFVELSPSVFVDVPSDAYYARPVRWAAESGVTNGTAPYFFSPEATCTRAQVVTFLWRANGEPEPDSSRNPFEDVAEGQYYYKAVLWAAEQGVTNGVDAKHFAPNAACTRGQVVTFLWRAMGKPASKSADNPFKDVTVQQYYYQAVLWAAEAGVTNGTSADKFSPESTCTRGQIVTFLYRAMNSNWEPGDPNLGLYRATLVEMNGLQVNADEIFKEGFLIELRDRGVCKIYAEGQSSMGSWSSENGTITIHENESTVSGTLSNGVIKLINMFGNGLDITLKRQS